VLLVEGEVEGVDPRSRQVRIPYLAFEQRGNTLKGFKGVHLNATARIWP